MYTQEVRKINYAGFSMEQVVELFALACSPPEDYGRPISHWTPRELTDEIIKTEYMRQSPEFSWVFCATGG